MDIRFYMSLLLRRLHYVLLLTVLGSAVGATLALFLPTVYVARAKLVVESEQIPGELAASTVDVQATEQLSIIQQRILARDTLVEMANRLQIYAAAPGERAELLDADELVDDMRQRISIITSGGTVARGPAQATLVDVSFEAPNAALASAVANDIVTLILKTDVEMRTGTARQTLEFFEQDVARLDKELSERSAAILKFKEANGQSLPDSLEFRRSQQAAAQERILSLQRTGDELQDRRDRLVRVHEATGATQEVPLPQQSAEQRQLSDLQNQLAASLAVLSQENPKIKLLKAQIAALEPIVARQASEGLTDDQGRELSAYDVQLADLDGQLSFLADQKTQIDAEIVALQATIDATPGNAITLDALERDSANTRMQYDQAVANKARAETGDTIEALSKGQRVTVIEQAVAPQDPDRPNRPLIAASGVAGGLAGGLGLVLLLEALNRGIRRPDELTAKLGITAFATLPYMDTAGEVRARRLRKAAVVVVALVVIVGVLGVINAYYMPLDLLLDRVIKRISFAVPLPLTSI